MRTWSIILGVVIFLCVVSVSFSHTVDLYKRVGFVLWEAVGITIAVETTFFLSGWSILWHRYRGQKPGGPAYAGFLYGVTLVLFSNAAYTVGLNRLFENDIAQWVLALSVVLGVLIAESIISQNLAELHRENGERRLQHDGGWSLQGKEEVEKEKEKVEEPTKEMENVSSPFDASTPSTSSTPSNNLSITAPTSNPSNSTASNSSTLSTPTVEKEKVEVEKVEKVENQEENHQEVEENRRPTVETVEVKKEVVEKIALEIYEQEGRLPGRKRLMEEAGVSEWEARKTLQELRKKVG